MNPRFDTDRQHLALNAKKNGHWDKEIRLNNLLHIGSDFNIQIETTTSTYDVNFYLFKY